jgi:hypothetical protein
MRHALLLPIALLAHLGHAQGPAVTSWIINPGSETGYGGFPSNVQSVHYTANDVYVTCSCIPGYDIGPWTPNPNLPANQNFCFRITRNPAANGGTAVNTPMGHIGVLRNGVSLFNPKDGFSYNNLGVWNRNALLFEGISFDACLGHPAPNGEYHHHVSPDCLYDYMNDEQHGDLIGYAFDGFPIYGAYGFANADGTGGVARMRSSYRLRSITDRTTLPSGASLTSAQYGPAIGGQYPLGAFLEDYEYVAGLGDLDAHNGRFCVTPEYPSGIYAYFVTLDEQHAPAYPYVLGPTYYGTVQQGNTGPASGHNTIPANAVLYVNGTTGIAAEGAPSFDVFPVPSNGLITVSSPGAAIRSIDVIDAQGRSALRMNGPAQRMDADLTELRSGGYLLRATMADGTTAQRRIVRD